MKKVLMIFFLFTTVVGYSQLSVNSAGKLVGAANTVVITTNDTSSFANSIISRVNQDTAFTRFIDAGEEFEFSTLWVRVPSSGVKSLQIKPIVGLMNRVSSSTIIRNGTTPQVNATNLSVTNGSWHYLDASADLTADGEMQTVWFIDATNVVMYEITLFNRASTTSFLKVKKY